MRLLFHSLLENVGGLCLKLNVQGQGEKKLCDVDRQGGGERLKIRQFSWTSYVYRLLTPFSEKCMKKIDKTSTKP